ncbi:hypothetical protein HYS91_00215 [Candidatus Daviesbacteria bacterium]|nr:hypothetical protein [Candidatus Daviesbacteria bacterium]
MKNFSKELAKILSEAVNNKIYGSVEIYFESGSVTQITQRIISKINNGKVSKKLTVKSKLDQKKEETKVAYSASSQTVN